MSEISNTSRVNDNRQPNTSGGSEISDASKGDRRRNKILTLLSEDPAQGISVNELAEIFGVSVATIRRDLARLEDSNVVSRTYGGAALAPTRRELTMAQRQARAAEEKRRIGIKAASLLEEGDVVILDAGSTSEQLAAAIDPDLEITVVTNGLRCIAQLVAKDRARVLVMGGSLRGANETICGPDAEEMLSRIYGDYAFIGADIIDPIRGVTSRTYDQARLKTLMMKQSANVFVIADSSKLMAFDDEVSSFWSMLPRKWNLITDTAARQEDLEELRRAGAQTIITV